MSMLGYETRHAEPEHAQPPPDAGRSSDQAQVSDLYLTVRKRWWMLAAALAAGAAYGLYQYATQPHLYVASGTIEIRSGSSNEFRVGTAATGEGVSRIPTQVAILHSDAILLGAARDLDLANNATFLGGPPARRQNLDDPTVRDGVLGGLRGRITVSTQPKTDVITITCSTLDAKLSADIVNALVRSYIQHSLQSRQDSTQRVTEFFVHQLDDLRRNVEMSQEQMIDMQKKLGVLGFDPGLNQVTANLQELTRAANAAELARIQAETQYHVLQSLDRLAIDHALGSQPSTSSPVSSIRSQLQTARALLAEKTAPGGLGPNHPQVQALRQQIAELTRTLHEEQDRVLTDAKQQYIAAKAIEDQTRGALNTQRDQAFKLRDLLIAFTAQQRQFDSNRTLYEGLTQRLRTAGVEAGLESTEIDILDVAVPPMAPSLRSRSSILLIDGSVALILGLVLVFLLDSLDTSLRSLTEIEAISGLPSLALIPRVNRRNSVEDARLSPALRTVTVLSTPRGQTAEAFRALRTSLLLSAAGGEPRVILLTSAAPAEGKTTVALNLACVLAQRDVRVLLMDADLRRPTVHHRLGLSGSVGLSSVLANNFALADAVQAVPEVPNLDVLVSGPIPPFPTELLGSESMRRLIETCRTNYTHVVIDSPPLLSVTDSVVLGRDADAVLLVVRSGRTTRHALTRARDLLFRAGSRLTGIVVNAVDLNSPEYYTYYGYSSYEGYGSGGVDANGWSSSSTETPPPSEPTPARRPGKGAAEDPTRYPTTDPTTDPTRGSEKGPGNGPDKRGQS